MQTGILKKIDVLVEMAESVANADTLRAELKEVEKEISELKEELAVLRESKESDKYFKISEKQVDENIKVSLEAKIKKQENAIKKLQKEIDNTLEEEAEVYNKANKLKEDIRISQEYIDELNNRLSTVISSSTKEYYETVLKDEQIKVKDLEEKLLEEEKNDKNILDSLNYLNQAMEEMTNILEDEKNRLQDTKKSLGGKSSYIDEELKQADEKRIQELQKKINDLDRRRLEIITDPAMIASEAKELIINDDRTNALTKLQELVTIVKAKPYMDIPSSNELTAMLQEEEEVATTARDEFASLIDTKNYSSGDTEVIEERINYLNSEIGYIESKINALKEEITLIDEEKFKDLTNHLTNTLNTYNQLQEELAEYKIIIETENEDKTPKRRAILAAAYDRKKKELDDVYSIIEHYKEDQKRLIKKAYNIENEQIKTYEKEISVYRQEIREMELLLENVSKAKDVLAIENDKQKLKDLDAAVKNIKHREKYSQTPSEIYDEIEIYLGTMDVNGLSTYETKDDSIDELPVIDDVDDILITEDDVISELPTEELVTDEIDNIPKVELNSDIDNSFVIGDYSEDTNLEELVEDAK